MDSPYLRTSDDLKDAVIAILTGGNAGMWEAQQVYGVNAVWGEDGKVTIQGTMAIHRNVEALLTETLEPELVTTSSEVRPEVTSTTTEVRPRSVETTLSQHGKSTTRTTRQGFTDEERVDQPRERTITKSSGKDTTEDMNVWAQATGDKINGASV